MDLTSRLGALVNGGLARRGDERGPGVPRELERLDQQLEGIAAGHPLDATLQVADRPCAQTRSRREFLLRESGVDAMATQQVPEHLRFILGHRRGPSPYQRYQRYAQCNLLPLVRLRSSIPRRQAGGDTRLAD